MKLNRPVLYALCTTFTLIGCGEQIPEQEYDSSSGKLTVPSYSGPAACRAATACNSGASGFSIDSQDRLAQLFAMKLANGNPNPNYPANSTLAGIAQQWLSRAPARDGYVNTAVTTAIDANNCFCVHITANSGVTNLDGVYSTVMRQMNDIGQYAYVNTIVPATKDPNIWRPGWNYILPWGLNTQDNQAVTALHFGVYDSVRELDYLNDRVPDKIKYLVEDALVSMGLPATDSRKYQRIVDTVPIAGGDFDAHWIDMMTPLVRNTYDQYMFELAIRDGADPLYTRPMHSYGDPARKNLGTMYLPGNSDIQRESPYARAYRLGGGATNSVVPNKGTTLAASEHPAGWYYAYQGVPTTSTDPFGILYPGCPAPDGNPNLYVQKDSWYCNKKWHRPSYIYSYPADEMLVQDLIATCVEVYTAQSWSLDPSYALSQCQAYWTSPSLKHQVCVRGRKMGSCENDTVANAWCNTHNDEMCPAEPTVYPIAKYDFVGGNTNDLSGNGFNAISNTATLTTGRHGTPNNAYYTTGTQNINYGTAITGGLNNLSVCAWFNKPTASNSKLVSRYAAGATTGEWYLSTTSSNQIYFYVGGALLTSSYVYYNDGGWHHVCGAYDGVTGRRQIFFDGQVVASTTAMGPATTSSINVYIGNWQGLTEPLNGAIDDVRIYNVALNQSDVEADIDFPEPAAKWSFANGAVDFSGNGMNGSVSSATLVSDHNGNDASAYQISTASSSYVDFGDYNAVEGIPEVTVCAWLKKSTPSTGGVVSKMQSGGFGPWYLIVESSGNIQFIVYRSDLAVAAYASATPAVPYSNGEWHHLCGVYNGSLGGAGAKLYYDGQLLATAAMSGNLYANTTTVRAGNLSGGGWPLNGTVDDIEVYTVAHGDTAIKNLYRGSAAAHFAFINGTASDISGNAYALVSNSASAAKGRLGTTNDAFSMTGSQSISYGDLGAFENRSDLGVCAWMKKNSQSDGVIVAKSTDFTTGSWLLSTKSTGQLQFSVTNSSSIKVDLAMAPLVPYHDDKWHLVCGSYDAGGGSSAMQLFYDGALLGSASHSGLIKNTTAAVRVGNHDSGSAPLNGSVDDVRLFKGALPASHVKDLFNAEGRRCPNCSAGENAALDWAQVAGGLVDIGAQNGVVFGVNSASQIYKRVGSSWVLQSGGLITATLQSDGKIWGRNTGGQVWEGTGLAPDWVSRRNLGDAVDVAANGGAVWITATDTCLYQWTGGTSWAAAACGYASAVDLDTQGQPWMIWGGDIWAYLQTTSGYGWYYYGTPGSATDIGVGDSEVWVVSGGTLKYLVKSASNFITDPTFSAQSGGRVASKVAVEKNGTVWVVATDSTIWRGERH